MKINDKYNLKLAYLMVAGGYLLLCVVVLASRWVPFLTVIFALFGK